MSEDSFRRISTPETWVGSGGRWSSHDPQEISEKRSVNEEPPTHQQYKVIADPDPGATEEEPSSYTEQDHYSESDFHDEEEEEEPDEQDEQNGQVQDTQIAVSQCQPEDFDTGSHLLHIDFITDELQTFRLSSHDGPHLRRAGTGGRKTFNQQQQQQHNISFSRERVRQIERTNQILLRRILSTKPTLQTLSIRPQTVAKRNSSTVVSRVTSAALNRQKLQKRIASDNEILLKKVTSIGLPKRTTS
ncbi:cilia- and flagella-associated protein 97-like [Anopheles darlingi]|uniref:cilia- and flagella-associated protein 97-like n=1 Tax=Anopheles darlingi TaxID=43151 RepID=UPI0021001C1F|nr:cilia- and flagella-associated protein 97-like [Anopheles darlingi]